MTFDFGERLRFGEGRVAETHPDTIRQLVGVPSCVSVVRAGPEADRRGVDYVATLRGGATLGIDVKSRDQRCSRFWGNGPELALEIWSVVPNPPAKGVAGWTLSESKATDYTLHVFHPEDTDRVYLLPFQLLRAAFHRRFFAWGARYKKARQHTTDGRREWWSECVFVPADAVMDAVAAEMSRAKPY